MELYWQRSVLCDARKDKSYGAWRLFATSIWICNMGRVEKYRARFEKMNKEELEMLLKWIA